MTTPDPLTQFLSGDNPYPFGMSLREHIGRYVEHIPHIVKLYEAEANDMEASAQDYGDDNPFAKDFWRKAADVRTMAHTIDAVRKDLTRLLEFVDWEHSFHNIGPTDLRPGSRALILKLVQGVDPGTFKIAIEIHNGNSASARVDMSRDEIVQTIEALTGGLGAIDDAVAHHESDS
jgi:hypothetical protein